MHELLRLYEITNICRHTVFDPPLTGGKEKEKRQDQVQPESHQQTLNLDNLLNILILERIIDDERKTIITCRTKYDNMYLNTYIVHTYNTHNIIIYSRTRILFSVKVIEYSVISVGY